MNSQAAALAVCLAVVDSACFGLAAVLQHRAVRRTVGRPTLDLGPAQEQPHHRLGLGQLGELVRRRSWLAGLALILFGGGLHILALILAPVSMIQPIGVLGVPIAVLAAAALARTRPAAVLTLPIGACVAGVAIFVWLSSGQRDGALTGIGPLVLGELIVLVLIGAFALAAQRMAGWARCLSSAIAAAIGFGMVSALVRGLADQLAGWPTGSVPLITTASSIMVSGIVLTGLIGGWLVQRAYASGPPEVVIACLTVVDPIVAVLLGFSVLGEGRSLGIGVGVAMAGCAVLAALGVIGLARFHPEAARRRVEAVPDGDHLDNGGENDFENGAANSGDGQQIRTVRSVDFPVSRVSLGAGKESP